MNFIIRWIVTAVGAAAAVLLVPGLSTVGSNSLVNVSIKPIAQLIGSPISVLTLGIFYLVVNALLLELAAWATNGLFGSGIMVSSFFSAFFGSIIISIVSALVNGLISDKQ